MASLYGRLQGKGDEVTRTGTSTSGIEATLETWEGRVRVVLEADGSFYVELGAKTGSFNTIARGNVGNDGRYLEVPPEWEEDARIFRPEDVADLSR